MNAQDRQQMLATAPIPGLVIRLSIPTIISMMVTALYNMADTFFVGQIGTSATAAVGVVFPLMAIIQAGGFFFGHGSGNTISRKLGAGDTESARQLSGCGFYLALFAGCIFALVCALFIHPLARMLGSTDTILPYTLDYLRIILFGAPFMMASFVLNNQLRFQGFAMYSMVGMASGGILNIFLDPLLRCRRRNRHQSDHRHVHSAIHVQSFQKPTTSYQRPQIRWKMPRLHCWRWTSLPLPSGSCQHSDHRTESRCKTLR